MDHIINLRLMAHPLNWGIVWIVVFIASFAVRELHEGIKGGEDCGCPKS